MLTNVCDVTVKWKGLVHLHSPSLHLLRVLSTSRYDEGSSKQQQIRRCFHILKVSEDSNIEDIRTAFIALAKKYHPDSGSPDADAKIFQEVESAYRILQANYSEEQRKLKSVNDQQNKDVQEFDIQHTAPQHRQYLSYHGYGSGTPSQRQKQYQKQKVMVAIDNVTSHRIRNLDKTGLDKENALVVKDKVEARKIKTRFGMDRLVEDLIQESMAKGDFDNLSGKGKPLKQGIANPYVDFTTQKLNEVLIDNGFTPEWILLQKEIREERDLLRQNLAKKRRLLGDLPLSHHEEHVWKLAVESCRPMVQQINSKINKYNLVVPILQKQMLQVQLEREAGKVLVEEQGRTSETSDQNTDYHKDGGGGVFSFFYDIFRK